ncbi:MAG: hypothetical protein QXF77_06405, partial [Candidatus Jordarchaeales archaeon]
KKNGCLDLLLCILMMPPLHPLPPYFISHIPRAKTSLLLIFTPLKEVYCRSTILEKFIKNYSRLHMEAERPTSPRKTKEKTEENHHGSTPAYTHTD